MTARTKKTVLQICLLLGIILIVGFFLFPIYWIFSTAFKNPLEAFQLPPNVFFLPTGQNFLAVFQKTDFADLALNSILVSTGSMVLSFLISFPAAYSIASFRM
jgi:ABC-type glycerol-3-phosphate transport system permease component